MIEVRLPWPDKGLLPNARVERYAHAELVKRHRFVAKIETLAQIDASGVQKNLAGCALAIDWTFHPPDKRWRDYDGMITAGKAYQDGIFDAIGLNDHLVASGTFQVLEMVAGGLYVIRIRPASGFETDTLTFIE